MTWLTESLRLTAFTVAPIAERVNWWRDLVGEAPETSTVNTKGGLTEVKEAGPFKSGRLALRIQVNRVDWVWGPGEEQAQESFASLGVFKEIIDGFVPPMQQWLAIGPPLNRLALGAVLLQPVESRQQGYRVLGERYLSSLNLDPV